jgi:lipopolysaccharide assembly outer membrane protein LptD (OstA)
MKKLFLAIALMIGLNSFAQDKTEIKIDKPEFKCDVVKFDKETNTIEFSGNVSFKTDIIELENADKILLNKETNEIIVSGLAEFTIDGAIQISEKAEKKIMRYKIGERIAYVE